MALEKRIENGLPIIPFISMLGEYARANITKQKIYDVLDDNFLADGEVVLTDDEKVNITQHCDEVDVIVAPSDKSAYLFEVLNVFVLRENDSLGMYADDQDFKDRLGYTV